MLVLVIKVKIEVIQQIIEEFFWDLDPNAD